VTEFKVGDRVRRRNRSVPDGPQQGQVYTVTRVTSFGDLWLESVDEKWGAWYHGYFELVDDEPSLADLSAALSAPAVRSEPEVVHLDVADARLLVALGDAFAQNALPAMIDHGEMTLSLDVGGIYRYSTYDGKVWEIEVDRGESAE